METRPEILTGPNSLGTYSCTRVTFPVSDVLPQSAKNTTQPNELKFIKSATPDLTIHRCCAPLKSILTFASLCGSLSGRSLASLLFSWVILGPPSHLVCDQVCWVSHCSVLSSSRDFQGRFQLVASIVWEYTSIPPTDNRLN